MPQGALILHPKEVDSLKISIRIAKIYKSGLPCSVKGSVQHAWLLEVVLLINDNLQDKLIEHGLDQAPKQLQSRSVISSSVQP